MIEVEKKFVANEENIQRLTTNAVFLGEKVFTDIYYDTEDFNLTRQDKWLRSRENKFELKLPTYVGNRLVDQYEELEDELKIKLELGLSGDVSLVDLEKHGFLPFCICTTTRKKFKKEKFIIDIDKVDFPNFIYYIGEIELMVSNQSEVKVAVDEILKFASDHHLDLSTTRGKVIAYLQYAKQDHFQALIAAGVVEEE